MSFKGFVLFYDVTNMESFQKLDRIKKDIDRFKDKREVFAIYNRLFTETFYFKTVFSLLH